MPATGPSSEHFGWPSFYEDPEAFWDGQERERLRRIEELEERDAERQVKDLLACYRERGYLRSDRLSYTRICQLEHETGVQSGSWTEYYALLREAQQRDEETWKSSTT